MMADHAPDQAPHPASVLVVEDEVLIRALLAETLRGQGLTVVEAMNADEAWTYLESGGVVDLLLSDIRMPGSMNGVELARRVRARYPQVKVILTSTDQAGANMAEIGVFIPKPYRLETAAAAALRSLGLPATP